MPKIEWARVLTVGTAVVIVQQVLGSVVSGLYPAITGWGFMGLTVGGVVTAGAGVLAGEYIYGMIKKR